MDGAERVALAHGPAVALLEVGRGPRQIEVVDRAGADLQVDALVGDRVGDDDVVLRRRGGVARPGAGAGRGRLGGEAVELAGDADAVRGFGLVGVQDGDALARDPVAHEHLAHPLMDRGRLAEDDVAAVRARGDPLRALGQLRGRVGRARQVALDLDRLAVPVDALGGHTALEGCLVGVAVLEGRVQGDQREAREQAEDRVGLAALRVRVGQDLLDLRDVMVVLGLLLGVHLDRDRLDDRGAGV